MTARAIMIQGMALATALRTRSVQAAELVDGDAELLQAIAGGDRSAFDRLSRRHLDRAYGVALRMTGSRADAQDVVQDVFLRLWQRPDAWRPGQAQFSTGAYSGNLDTYIGQVYRAIGGNQAQIQYSRLELMGGTSTVLTPN